MMRFPPLSGVFVGAALAAASPSPSEIVSLWPAGAPGAIAQPAYVEGTIYRDTEATMPRLVRVTDPRLEVHLPPAHRATGSAVVVCPGGGYAVLAYEHEGEAVAAWLNSRGIAAFVLKYRLPSDAIMEDKAVGPLQDAQEAIRLVRRRAEEWGVDPGRVAMMGFSAGGHLAATASTLFDDRVYPVNDDTSARPDLSILIYPVISMEADVTHGGSRLNLLGEDPSSPLVERFTAWRQVTAATPPTFLLHSADDGAVPVANSLRHAQALRDHGVPFALHVYPTGGHGYGLGQGGDTPDDWPRLLEGWLRRHGW
jgi:acetyl esterase/lipase